MSNDVVEVLTKARALVERGHCKGDAAQNARRQAVSVNDSAACAWCALGAIWASGGWEFTDKAADALRGALGVRSIGRWNDAPERTQADVLAAFDRAIEACGGEA